MNEVIASNVRMTREQKAWTQEHLAAAACVAVRTVQRLEAGHGANVETLKSIASAMKVDVELLRFDAMGKLAELLGVSRDKLTPEYIAEIKKEAEAQYTRVPLHRLKTSADLRRLSDATSLYFECEIEDDGVQNTAAVLQQDLIDLIDIRGVIEAPQLRELEVSAFETVKTLAKLGAIVSVGLHRHLMKGGTTEPMPWTSLYVIVTREADVRDVMLIEKNQRVQFR